jgi:hypothetical protein
LRPAGSFFGDFRTPIGARNSSRKRTGCIGAEGMESGPSPASSRLRTKRNIIAVNDDRCGALGQIDLVSELGFRFCGSFAATGVCRSPACPFADLLEVRAAMRRFDSDCRVSRTQKMGPGAPGGEEAPGRPARVRGGGPNCEPEMQMKFWEDSSQGVEEANQCRASDRVCLGLPVIVIPAPPRDLRRFPRTTF